MGFQQSCTNHNKIICLNYSGILNSPFQFYATENQQQLSQISYIFQKNLSTSQKNYKRQSFKWQLGKIDVKMQNQRYSCLYNPDVGVQHGRLLNKNQFKQLWEKKLQQNYESLKEKFNPSTQEKKQALKFDYMCYKSILDFVYHCNTEQSQLQKLDVKQYRNFMKKCFSLPFLNEQKKIKKTLQALKNLQISICFLMQVSQHLISALKDQPEFQIIEANKMSSIIVIRKSKFQKIWTDQQTKNHLKELYQQMSWNQDSVVGIVDDIIIISAHLSSKKQKNQNQVRKMLDDLKKLKNKNFNFIVGVDANSQIEAKIQQLKLNLNYFPLKNQITSSKKRTFLQPQVIKANQQIQKSGDFVITSFQILGTSQVQNIQGKSVRLITPNLPTSLHPYDHFAIVCQIDLNSVGSPSKKNA